MLTWLSWAQGVWFSFVLQDDGQSYWIRREDGITKIHTGQALRLTCQAAHSLSWAKPGWGVPSIPCFVGSQHNVDDTLLLQVTALCGRRTEWTVSEMKLRVSHTWQLSAQCPSIRSSMGQTLNGQWSTTQLWRQVVAASGDHVGGSERITWVKQG